MNKTTQNKDRISEEKYISIEAKGCKICGNLPEEFRIQTLHTLEGKPITFRYFTCYKCDRATKYGGF